MQNDLIVAEAPRRIEVPQAELQAVQALYDQGLMLQAWRRAQTVGPLRQWRGVAQTILAGRLLSHVGAMRVARALLLRAARLDPADGEARYFACKALSDRRSAYEVWRLTERLGMTPTADKEIQADWLALKGNLLGRLRDFSRAEELLAAAEKLTPNRPWLYVERASLLEYQDRVAEALAVTEEALARKPWHNASILMRGHLLQIADRQDEALELLTAADREIESGPVALQLVLIHANCGRPAESWQALDRVEELMPELDDEMRSFVETFRSDAAYFLGRIPEAIEHARKSKHPFYGNIAEQLEQNEGSREVLPVPFIRQNRDTCAPATLAAISRYWSMPADHLEVAAAICYNGTPDHSERGWAEENGWLAREFTVTWTVAQRLIDRGVPFTLTTIEPGAGHLQGVVGYDSRRGTLVLREPSMQFKPECFAEGFLRQYQPSGPRGMVLVPLRERERLEGLHLPDAELYDFYFHSQRHLAEHRRADAQRLFEELRALAPFHRLTALVRRMLANYDSNPYEGLAALEQLLLLYPSDLGYRLARHQYLIELGRDEEARILATELNEDQAPHPQAQLLLVRDLQRDAREHRLCERLLRRVMRKSGAALAEACHLFGSLRWDQNRFDEGLELFRFSACLMDKLEGPARSYFEACRQRRRTEEGLEFLRERFQRYGQQAAGPAGTLAWAYQVENQLEQAEATLAEARRLRPNDGDVCIIEFDHWMDRGEWERAEEALAAAAGLVAPGMLLRRRAQLAKFRNQSAEAADLWRQVLAIEPLALDAHREAVLAVAEAEGPDGALRFLDEACARAPAHFELARLRIAWLKEKGAEAPLPALQALAQADPRNAWVRRELALTLVRLGRSAAALTEAEAALALEPSQPSSHGIHGLLLAELGRKEEARAALQKALELSVDYEVAQEQLFSMCEGFDERCAALRLFHRELLRQTHQGDSVLTYRALASGTLEDEVVLSSLRALQAARPELWQTWVALIRQLLDRARQIKAGAITDEEGEKAENLSAEALDEALHWAVKASERFSLLPRIWLVLASVHRQRAELDEERKAIERALKLNPLWGEAARELSETYAKVADFSQAAAVLEEALARDPLDAFTHGYLAEVRWKQGKKDEAVKCLRRAVELSPDYDWAWAMLGEYARELGSEEDSPAALARELTRTRPQESQLWIRLAQTLTGPETIDERLQALDQALALRPHQTEVHDLKARVLTEAGRYDEALAACSGESWNGRPPLPLRGRAAWVLAEKGELPAALEQMRGLLAEDPDYLWGWETLRDWLRTQEDQREELIKACQACIRLDPGRPTSYALLGEALIEEGELEAGEAALWHSMQMAPDYEYAGLTMIDVLLHQERWKEAGEVIAQLAPHTDAPFLQARIVKWAACLQDWHRAWQEFAVLLEQTQPNSWPIDTALAAFQVAGRRKNALRKLGERVQSGPIDRYLVQAWIEQLYADSVRKARKAVDALVVAKHANAVVAAESLLRKFGYARHRAALAFCRKHAAVIRREPDLLAMASFALQALDASGYRALLRLLQGWDEWEKAPATLLLNSMLAYRGLRQDEEARQLSTRALETVEAFTVTFHAQWLGLDHCLADEPAAGLALIEAHPLREGDHTHKYLEVLVRALAAVQLAPPEERRAAWLQARKDMAAAAREFSPVDEDRLPLGIAYTKAIKKMAAVVNSLEAKLWRLWRQTVPCLPCRGYSNITG